MRRWVILFLPPAALVVAALVFGLSLVDVVVIAGLAAVVPAALGGAKRWAVAGAAALGSFLLPTGALAASVAAPAALIAGLTALVAAARVRGLWGIDRRHALVRLVACVDAVVATGALVQSRAGVSILGTYEPIIELTAVHFTYAGVAALVLAGAAADRATGVLRSVGSAAILLTAGAPPVVALGFVTGDAILQVGGAVLMTAGVCATAGLELVAAARLRRRIPSTLLAVSGLAVWVPMALAIAWAAGQHWSVPALSISDMVRTHGLVNAVAFVGCGLAAVHVLRRTDPASPTGRA